MDNIIDDESFLLPLENKRVMVLTTGSAQNVYASQ